MKSKSSRPSSRGVFLAAIGLCLLSGCSLSNEQKLIGRWYNRELTIRFRPDGGVVMNSPAGRAVGRYFYDGTIRRRADDQPRENLVLDVVRNDERVRMGFELEIISPQRIRLYDLSRGPRVNNTIGKTYSNEVLKRAEEDDDKLAI